MSASRSAENPASTGKRNRAMAAPRPRFPPAMPVKNARLDSTWVLSAGPPRVRMKITIMSAKVKTNAKRIATSRIGERSGSVIWNRVRK